MSAIAYPSLDRQQRKSWFTRPLVWRISPAGIALGLIIFLSLGLHFYHIQSVGNANTYYTAAVKSMLQSWHNFFFVSAEPGGSVTVDKPPLGFWIEAAFATGLGVSGFSVVLPNILAGVLSIPLLYHLVRKYFGVVAGLTAALVLAITPVTLAVDRNNTIDGMLVFSLLLAAWAFIHATETGKLRYLLLGALLVGLGFNIKMLQAFLPLPAFYALYLLGARAGWRRKFLNLALASVLLGVVSFSWAAVVDGVPASQRPFVGSTRSNSEMELIFGYNGISRLLGGVGRFRSRIFPNNLDRSPLSPGDQVGNPRAGNPPAGAPAGLNFTGRDPGANGRAGGYGGMFNTGQPGVFRFFQAPLAKELSWLLPMALFAIGLSAVSSRIRLPVLTNEHKGLLLWGGWLVTCLVFFSIAGFFHNYYLATMSPALGALVGMGVASILRLKERSPFFSITALLVAAGATLAFQDYLVSLFGLNGDWVGLAVILLIGAAVISLLIVLRSRRQGLFFHLASLAALAAILVIPALWSVRTVASAETTPLPEAYPGDLPRGLPGLGPQGMGAFNFERLAMEGGFIPGFAGEGRANAALLAYLQANTQGMKYMVAVPSAMVGSNLVLATGRPVLYMGGFSGADPVIDAAGLARLVATGQLRFVLSGGAGPRNGSSDISNWLQRNCQAVPQFSQQPSQSTDARERFGSILYRCGP